jgi:hypothetical protein
MLVSGNTVTLEFTAMGKAKEGQCECSDCETPSLAGQYYTVTPAANVQTYKEFVYNSDMPVGCRWCRAGIYKNESNQANYMLNNKYNLDAPLCLNCSMGI